MGTFNFKDKNGNQGTVEGVNDTDYATLNDLIEAVNIIGQSSSARNFINSILRKDFINYTHRGSWSSNRTSVTTPSDLYVNVDSTCYEALEPVTLSLADATNWDNSTYTTGSNRAGKDFYIYACVTNDGLKFVLSANSTVPTGYTASNSRKIGGFHCLCLDVGTISGHPASGYVTGDIIPLSVWDLLHRPICSPEGMVYIEELNKWVAIYLPSWDGSKLVSRFGGVIVDGGSTTAMDGEQFAEFAGLSKCHLHSRDEFKVFAFGSNQKTSIAGSTDPVTTGGHTDTAGRRMISNYFIEDCCGVIWQWSRDLFEAMSITWNSNNPWIDGYSWQTKSVVSTIGDSSHRDLGSCHGLLRRALVGGNWGNGSRCGSRSVSCIHFGSVVGMDFSGRLVSDNINLSL